MDNNKLYTEMINELSSQPAVTIIKNDFYLKDELVPGVLEKHPYFKSIRDDLPVLNDNYFSWSYQQKSLEPMPMGESHFIALEETLSQSNKKEILYDIDGHKEQGTFYPFDDHPDGGDGIMGCFKIIDKGYEIWLHNENSEMFLIELDLPGYLEQTYKLKALYSWQYLFITINWNQPFYNVVKSDLRRRIQILESLFPGQSYKDLLKKIN
jgi:hypothetical protein